MIEETRIYRIDFSQMVGLKLIKRFVYLFRATIPKAGNLRGQYELHCLR